MIGGGMVVREKKIAANIFILTRINQIFSLIN